MRRSVGGGIATQKLLLLLLLLLLQLLQLLQLWLAVMLLL